MNGDVTVREVMRREFVGVSEGDTLADTATLMLEEDVEAVVVLHGQSPAGILTQQDILAVAADGTPLSEARVVAAMTEEPPTVAPQTPLATATDLMSGRPARHLLVMDGGELVGLLSEHDVVTASTLNPGVNGETSPEPESEAMVTETAAAATAGEGGQTTAEEEYSNQGICEVCGSLSRDLSTFNGQLVCSDCKDV